MTVYKISNNIGKQLFGSSAIIDKAATKEDENDGEERFDSIDWTEISKVTAELQKSQGEIDDLTQRLFEL